MRGQAGQGNQDGEAGDRRLLAVYRAAPNTATVLRDLGAVLAPLGQPQDALALFAQADKVGGRPVTPMGVSETATELNDRGLALLELRQWTQAGAVLAKAVAAAPLLAEAKLNLGVALMCQHKNAQAAKMIFAGARRTPLAKYDSVENVTVPPAGQVVDLSHGHADGWPSFTFPETVTNMVIDGDTFRQFWQDYENATTADNNKSTALRNAGAVGMSPISSARISNLGEMAFDGIAGGWASLQTTAQATEAKADNFYDATLYSDGPGSAGAKLKALEAAGGDPCATLKPAFVSFLTSKTEEFHDDVVAWNTAQRAPATTMDQIDKCPKDLARASFNFDLSIFSISVNCEKVTVGTSAPGLGPFVKVTVAFTGDVTVMAGVKAGQSLGPASVGVRAGAYITMHGDTITDAGVTVSASASVKAGPISLSGPSASATVTVADVSGAVNALIQG